VNLVNHVWFIFGNCYQHSTDVFYRYDRLAKNVVDMSKSELLAKLKQVQAQIDATVELLGNTSSLPFSLDDEYDADYLVSCLESNSRKLHALAKKCQSVVTEQTGMPLTSSLSESSDTYANRVDQSANQSAVDAANADNDDTASLDSSDASTPLCGDSVSIK